MDELDPKEIEEVDDEVDGDIDDLVPGTTPGKKKSKKTDEEDDSLDTLAEEEDEILPEDNYDDVDLL